MNAALECFVSLLNRRELRPQMNGNGSGKSLCPSHQDRNPSLSFKSADQHAGVIAKCHACDAKLDQMLKDLGADESEARLVMGLRGAPAPSADRHFLYHGPDGAVRFRVVRTPDKRFFQNRPDGTGGWISDVVGVELVPYRLPELMAARDRGETLWIAEGEKCVDVLAGLGLAATCNPGGAGKWRDDYSVYLRGARAVVICADNDEPGAKHVDKVAASLLRISVSNLTLVSFPGAAKRDVADWLFEQPLEGRRELLLEYVRGNGHPPRTNGGPPTTPADPKPPKHPPLTDTGNAERLIAAHAESLRYAEQGAWIGWDGRLWREDQFAAIRLAKKTVRDIYREAAGASDEQRQALAKHALRSESARALEAMVSLSRSGLTASADQFDTDPWALNVDNGTVDLRTGELRPHRRSDFITKLAPVRFDPAARHPVWDGFLERMVPDPEVRSFLQRAAGYTLTGETSEEKLFFIHGPTASGKSTFIAALTSVLGDYSSTCNFETFLQSEHGGGAASTDLARLPGVRMAVSLEVDEGRKLAVSLLKTITGRDRISARHLYQKSFLFVPHFKLWLVANDKPRASASDAALWRRILMVPFEESLAESEQDPTIKSALTNDPAVRSAILAWAVAGVAMWRDGGLNSPAAIRAATTKYRDEQDTVGEFLDEKCVLGSGCVLPNDKLRKCYEEWATANGERPMSATALGIRLRAHGLVQTRGNHGRMWMGIRLKDSAEQLSTF